MTEKQSQPHHSARTTDAPWLPGTEKPGRVPPRECIAAARDALNKAYAYPVAPWPLIAQAVDWQRRALEQMVEAEADALGEDGADR